MASTLRRAPQKNISRTRFTSVFCPFTGGYIHSRSAHWQQLQRMGFGVDKSPTLGRHMIVASMPRLIAAAKSLQIETERGQSRKQLAVGVKKRQYGVDRWHPALRSSLGELLLTTDVTDPRVFTSTLEFVLAEEGDVATAAAAFRCDKDSFHEVVDMTRGKITFFQATTHDEAASGASDQSDEGVLSKVVLAPSACHEELCASLTAAQRGGEGKTAVLSLQQFVEGRDIDFFRVDHDGDDAAIHNGRLLVPGDFDDVSLLVIQNAELLRANAVGRLDQLLRCRAASEAFKSPFGGVQVVLLVDLTVPGVDVLRSSAISALYRGLDAFESTDVVRAYCLPVESCGTPDPASIQFEPTDADQSSLAGGNIVRMLPTRTGVARQLLGDAERAHDELGSHIVSIDTHFGPLVLPGRWTFTVFVELEYGRPKFWGPVLEKLQRQIAASLKEKGMAVHVAAFPIDYTREATIAVRAQPQDDSQDLADVEKELLRAAKFACRSGSSRRLLRRPDAKEQTIVAVREPQTLIYPNWLELKLWSAVYARHQRLKLHLGMEVVFCATVSCPRANSTNNCTVTHADSVLVEKGTRGKVVGFAVRSAVDDPQNWTTFLMHQDEGAKLPIVELRHTKEKVAVGPAHGQVGGSPSVFHYQLPYLFLPLKSAAWCAANDLAHPLAADIHATRLLQETPTIHPARWDQTNWIGAPSLLVASRFPQLKTFPISWTADSDAEQSAEDESDSSLEPLCQHDVQQLIEEVKSGSLLRAKPRESPLGITSSPV